MLAASLALMIGDPILLAEDNENDTVLFRHQLRMAQILNPLQAVTDGEQVIDYLDGQGKYADRLLFPLPVVLFLDLRMPKIGGYQILSFLQASALHRHLPVLVLSVLGDLKDVGEAYQRGAKSFLIKPLEAVDLLRTLRGISGLELKLEKEGFRLERSDKPPVSPGLAAALETVRIEPYPKGAPRQSGSTPSARALDISSRSLSGTRTLRAVLSDVFHNLRSIEMPLFSIERFVHFILPFAKSDLGFGAHQLV